VVAGGRRARWPRRRGDLRRRRADRPALRLRLADQAAFVLVTLAHANLNRPLERTARHQRRAPQRESICALRSRTDASRSFGLATHVIGIIGDHQN
jgi:hypothetical protein